MGINFSHGDASFSYVGINFSHGDASFSYAGFHDFRKKIANLIGINLDDMQGFGGKNSWKKIDHPLKNFLNHSDCDGFLSSKEMKVIAPALVTLFFENKIELDSHSKNIFSLVNGMKEAIAKKEKFEFT